MTEPKKMDLKSMDITEDKMEQLRQLFPEVVTEKKIDFEKLKSVLGEMIETGKERYGLNWAGKADCFKIIQQSSVGTLKPCREESLNFDETENLFIEGDNLEVLKLLQKAYYGKIKMMYFDPPYNTGNDFIYPDDYSESLDTYLKYTGQVDSEGRKYSTNTEADGRFHTKWINMMYPRLYLAKNLLKDDGVIFISINDVEQDNLKKICNEIFGEENFIACIAVVNNLKGRSDDKYIAASHEYILIYQKGKFESYGIELPESYVKEYDQVDKDGRRYRLQGLRKRGSGAKRQDRPKMYYPFYYDPISDSLKLEQSNSHRITIYPKLGDGTDGRWRWGQETARGRLLELIAKKVSGREEYDVFQKDYLSDEEGQERRPKPKSAWIGSEFSSDSGTIAFRELGLGKAFENPKSVELLKACLTQSTKGSDLVMDIFAGSSTLAQAVFELNQEDPANRSFICVQLPEICDETSEAFKLGFKTVAEVGKERIRRVIKEFGKQAENQLDLKDGRPDLGFKVFKLDKSCFKIWEAENVEENTKLEKQLQLHIDHIDPKSTQEDILYELLLKSGFDLATKIEKLSLAGKTVFSIAAGAMLICLEEKLTKDVINAMADIKPSRVICLDKGFKDNDQLKANAVQIMKSKKVNTFLTV